MGQREGTYSACVFRPVMIPPPPLPPSPELDTLTPRCSFRGEFVCFEFLYVTPIVKKTVVCLVAKPLSKSEAEVDLVMIQTLLTFQMQITSLSC